MRQHILAILLATTPITAAALTDNEIDECRAVANVAQAVSEEYHQGDTLNQIYEDLGVASAPVWAQNVFFQIHGSLNEFYADRDEFVDDDTFDETFGEIWFDECVRAYRQHQGQGSPLRQSYSW